MVSEDISKKEYESALNALEKILETDVENIEISDKIPPLVEVSDSNKVFEGKLSILFVDMRKSSDLTDLLGSEQMVKIYRSFIRLIIQAIRYSDGYSRQFAGDGIMGVFQDEIDDNENIAIFSSEKATIAARYIITLIDYCLNPLLKKHISDVVVGCGIGIATGNILITKAGMKGKESDDETENETGIIWVGSTTNYSNKLCNLTNSGEIFIDNNTYDEFETTDNWEKTSRTKGTKIYEGHISEDYYLNLPEDVETDSIKSDETNSQIESFVQNIFEETQENIKNLIDEIIRKSEELGRRLKDIEKREQEISVKEDKLNQKERDFEEKRTKNLKKEFESYKKLFASVYLKPELVKSTGRQFWNQIIENAIEIGNDLDMSRSESLKNLDFHLYPIYCYLSDYDSAYNSLCRLAEKKRHINSDIVKKVAIKRGKWYTLESILEKVTKDDSPNKMTLLIVLDKLKGLKN